MQNPEYYLEALKFYGFRFADRDISGSFPSAALNFRQLIASKLVDTDQTWHVWGTGRMAW